MALTTKEREEKFGYIWKVADHYNGLANRGVPENVAMELTSEFQAILLEQAQTNKDIKELRERIEYLETGRVWLGE